MLQSKAACMREICIYRLLNPPTWVLEKTAVAKQLWLEKLQAHGTERSNRATWVTRVRPAKRNSSRINLNKPQVHPVTRPPDSSASQTTCRESRVNVLLRRTAIQAQQGKQPSAKLARKQAHQQALCPTNRLTSSPIKAAHLTSRPHSDSRQS